MASLDTVNILLQAGVVGAGLLSGLFFIFSFCVMKALNTQPPASAIATMNSINAVIVNPPFMLVFMGTPIVCAVLLGFCINEGFGVSIDNKLAAAGSLVLLIGEFVLTLAVHIPKNNALAAYLPGSSGNDDLSTWAKYYITWTAWNHVRMMASVATVALLSSALQLRATRLASERQSTQMR